MKIMIFGANGMLGRYLVTDFQDRHTVIPVTRKELDLLELTEVALKRFVKKHKPDLIINAAGLIKQRNPKVLDLVAVNTVFPQMLGKLKEELGAEIIHITTDCVFSGRDGDYTETSLHDCTDEYGKTKSLGEHPKLTIIRTSIIGEEYENKLSLIEWVKSQAGKEVQGYVYHDWNGVTCLELCKVIERVIESGAYWEGVQHIFSPNTVTKGELVKMISDAFGLNVTVVPTVTDVVTRTLSTNSMPMVTTDLFDQLGELSNFKLA